MMNINPPLRGMLICQVHLKNTFFIHRFLLRNLSITQIGLPEVGLIIYQLEYYKINK